MRKLKRAKKLLELIDDYTKDLKSEIEKIKKDHQKIVLESNSKLLSQIAKGENLDELSLIEKYLKKSKQKPIVETSSEVSEKSIDLLNHISLEGEDYFYEDKPNGKVFNNKSKKVGEYKCGQIKFDS